MDYKYKNFILKVLSALPRGEKVNYLFQKFLSKNLPISESKFIEKAHEINSHYYSFKKYRKNNGGKYMYFEFGAGWDLFSPIFLSLTQEFSKLLCIDIRKLIFKKLISGSVTNFEKLKDKLPISFKDSALKKYDKNSGNILKFLEKNYNIVYKAPVDARDTGLEEESIDFISSTATFEHIPAKDILPILEECFRFLKKGGICSFNIDYKDHWAYFDSNISYYNFLKFSEKEWRKQNPSLHYQNRLRHTEYINLINKTNFLILEEYTIKPNEEEISVLKNLSLNQKFKDNYSIEELGIKGSHIVLMKQ